MLTQEYLKSILDYNNETGVFTWKVSKQGNKGVGSVAYCLNKGGYIKIQVNGKRYYAHRLAWLYVYGAFPENHIDHINGQKDDNRISNLREVTHRENHQNRNCHRNGNLVGTTYSKKDKKWRARIYINNKLKHIGYFDTKEQAHEAYMNKLKELENGHT